MISWEEGKLTNCPYLFYKMDKDIKDFYDKNKMDLSGNIQMLPDSSWPQNWITIFYKTYPRFEQILLEPNDIQGDLVHLLRGRSSKRHFTQEPVSKRDLDTLVYFSMGLKDPSSEKGPFTRRFYPSGGARYPVEGYLFANNISGLDKGLFHYCSKMNTWESLLKQDLTQASRSIFGQEITVDNPNFLLLTSVMSRPEVKYGIHALRLSLLEAGHIGQNIALLSQQLGIGSCPLAGFSNDEVVKLLDLPEDEIPVYAWAIGNIDKSFKRSKNPS